MFKSSKIYSYSDDLGTTASLQKNQTPTVGSTPSNSNLVVRKNYFYLQYNGADMPNEVTVTRPNGEVERYTGLISEAYIDAKNESQSEQDIPMGKESNT